MPNLIALRRMTHTITTFFLMYKSIESSKKSVMECVFVKCDKNIIIHYHKIKNKEINEARIESRNWK